MLDSWRSSSEPQASQPSPSGATVRRTNEQARYVTSMPDGSMLCSLLNLFNEGVDVPNVDTLLLLRPTESPTLFLQQLGRGLRRASGKAICTVLDFVGN